MTEKIFYWASVVCSLFALLLFITDTALISGNRSLQVEINARQDAINRAGAVSPLNQNLARALADSSLKNNDTAIRDMLEAQGIIIRKPEASPAAPAKKKVGDE